MFPEHQPLQIIVPDASYTVLWAAPPFDPALPVIGTLPVIAWAVVSGVRWLEPMVIFNGMEPSMFCDTPLDRLPKVSKRIISGRVFDTTQMEGFLPELRTMAELAGWTDDELRQVLDHAGIRA